MHEKTFEQTHPDMERFIYQVSHDLAGPLRHTREFSRLLLDSLDGKLDPEEQHLASVIQQSVNIVEARLDALTKLYRVIAEPLQMEEINLQTIFNDVLTELQPLIAKSNISVSVASLPKVVADATQIAGIVFRLISNSIQFARDDIHSFINVKSTIFNGYHEVTFEDNGVGIDPLREEKLFTLFYSDRACETANHIGAGLTLCKAAIERHGGRIWWDPAADNLTRICFTIPISPVQAIS